MGAPASSGAKARREGQPLSLAARRTTAGASSISRSIFGLRGKKANHAAGLVELQHIVGQEGHVVAAARPASVPAQMGPDMELLAVAPGPGFAFLDSAFERYGDSRVCRSKVFQFILDKANTSPAISVKPVGPQCFFIITGAGILNFPM